MAKNERNQIHLRVARETYDWVRTKAFNERVSQASIIEKLIIKEMEKDERRNNNK